MDAFTISVAGLIAHVQPMFVSTIEYCRTYLTDQKPDCFIQVSDEDLAFQQARAEREAIEEGIRIRKYTGPYLERATILYKVTGELLQRDTLLFHGSTVAVDGEAYLFTAPCGTGKSTHTRLWCQKFGDRALMINDDKPFLQVTEDAVFACGSPWSGKHGLDSNVRLPLRGICILCRGSENRIRKVDPDMFLPFLRKQCICDVSDTGPQLAFSLLSKILDRIPVWELTCTKDVEAASVSYSAMSEG